MCTHSISTLSGSSLGFGTLSGGFLRSRNGGRSSDFGTKLALVRQT